MLVILFLVCLSSAWCAPQSRRQPANQAQPSAPVAPASSPIPIISHSETINGDGSFNYSYETGNGIRVQEGGYIKKLPLPQGHSASLNADEVDADGGGISVQVVTGSYSYKTPNGTEISLTYIADENGFQPKGAHLPTPPPIPPEILKSLQLLPKSEDQQENNYQDKGIQESASNTDEIQDYNNPSHFDLLRRKRRIISLLY